MPQLFSLVLSDPVLPAQHCVLTVLTLYSPAFLWTLAQNFIPVSKMWLYFTLVELKKNPTVWDGKA